MFYFKKHSFYDLSKILGSIRHIIAYGQEQNHLRYEKPRALYVQVNKIIVMRLIHSAAKIFE
jgi:hypothetical protein